MHTHERRTHRYMNNSRNLPNCLACICTHTYTCIGMHTHAYARKAHAPIHEQLSKSTQLPGMHLHAYIYMYRHAYAWIRTKGARTDT